jgi:LacI family transcriptional regulator
MKKTIKEIARLSGVSPATVSKAINNYSDIGEETKTKIFEVINQIGYQPVSSNKSSSRKLNLIGVVFAGRISADLNHPFFADVINTFKKEMGKFGYDLLFFSNEKYENGEGDFLADCRAAQIRGCIIIGGNEIQQNIYDLDHSELPCIGVDIELTGRKSGYLITDNYKLAKSVVEHLYLLGHREIAYIGGIPSSIVGQERTNGFIQAMNEYGLTINEGCFAHGDYKVQSGYDITKSMLEQNNLPRALFAASDLMAYGAITAIREKGLSIPEDVAVIGCDDIESSQFISPSLTTVRQDKEKIGKLAAHMMMDMIQDVSETCSVRVDSELIIRNSCGHASRDHRNINQLLQKEVVG